MRAKGAPIWEKDLISIFSYWFGRGTGKTRITIFAYGESHVKPLTPK